MLRKTGFILIFSIENDTLKMKLKNLSNNRILRTHHSWRKINTSVVPRKAGNIESCKKIFVKTTEHIASERLFASETIKKINI